MTGEVKMPEVPEPLAAELSDIRNADTTKLAYIGDAVYELLVRMKSVEACGRHAGDMNRYSVHYVRADSQALAAKGLVGDQDPDASGSSTFLTPDEMTLFKRARNRTNTSHPRGSTPAEYKLATGLEAVIGWLYIKGESGRLSDLIEEALRIIDER